MPAHPPLPSDGARLLSDMGMRRGRRTGEPTFHAGMDLGHPDGLGTPVFAVQGGVVERVLNDSSSARGFGGYGNGVIINHGDGTWALYAHLQRAQVSPGETVHAGQQVGTMGATSNGRFRGMGVHLHLELRRARPDGRSPFPGPYRTYNLDPRPWLESKGLRFGSRGSFEVVPGTAMASGGSAPSPTFASAKGGKASMAGLMGCGCGSYVATPVLGQVDENAEYEPPARFDRDVYVGLTPVEWAAAGAGALVLTGVGVATVLKRRR
jgi:hypothetical protein